MSIFRTSNPTFSDSALSDVEPWNSSAGGMTVQGTAHKCSLLLSLVLIGAGFSWWIANPYGTPHNIQAVIPWMIGGFIGGLIFALITMFAKTWSPVTAPLYALFEGVFLGGLSAVMELRFPNIVLQAVGLTFATALSIFLLYQLGVLRATQNFVRGVTAATMAIGLVYLATIVLRLFGVGVPFIHDSGPIGIAFSVFVVVIAALNLVLDFDLIEQGADRGLPRYMEWYAAFGLMVTLVWLYIEILRLLSKLRSRN